MKRSSGAGLVAIMFVLAFSVPAAAQAKKGNSELLVFGYMARTTQTFDFGFGSESTSSTTGQFNLSVGQFITNGLQVGTGPSVGITRSSDPFSGDSSTDVTFGLTSFIRQHFGSARVAPYIGAELQTLDLKKSDETTFVNLVAGLKNYLSEDTALDLRGGYGFFTGEGDLKQLVFTVGITHLF